MKKSKRLRVAKLSRKQREIRRINKILDAGRKFYRSVINFDLTPVDSADAPSGKVCYFD